jgi:hypothetical protein
MTVRADGARRGRIPVDFHRSSPCALVEQAAFLVGFPAVVAVWTPKLGTNRLHYCKEVISWTDSAQKLVDVVVTSAQQDLY